MNNDLEAYLRGPEPMIDDSYTALQRQALGEMLHLSAEIVDPLVGQVESEYQTTRDEIQRRFDEDTADVEQELKGKSEQLRTEHGSRTEDIQAEYEGQLSAIKVEAQHKRKKVIQTAAELEQKAEKQCQELVMVTDFVGEGAVTKRKQKQVEAKAAYENAQQYLANLAAQADQLLRLYRHAHLKAGKPTEFDHAAEAETPDAKTYAACQKRTEQQLEALQRLRTAQLFIGARPIVLGTALIVVIATALGIVYHIRDLALPPAKLVFPIVIVASTILVVLGTRLLWQKAKRYIRQTYDAFQEALTEAHKALDRHTKQVNQAIEQEYRQSIEQKQAELKRARDACEQTKGNVAKQRKTSLQDIELSRHAALTKLQQTRDQARRTAEDEYQQRQAEVDRQAQETLTEIRRRYDKDMTACEDTYQQARRNLEDRWDKGLACIRALLDRTHAIHEKAKPDWDHLLTGAWAQPDASSPFVRFGAFPFDPSTLAESVRTRAGSLFETAATESPALLELPDRCSMLLQSERDGRHKAIQTLRAVMVRLFTSLPPGRVRFTILDPVGLGENFAGFMHAADYQESLVGGRIWTEAPQIRQQLEDLTQHMENVIQKYLRNEFETIEQYNEQAGELAEPYRFLVIADFPNNFTEEAARRLTSIIQSGPRCGVHTLIAYDTRQELPAGMDMADITTGSVHLLYRDHRYTWNDSILEQFPLALDRPPAETTLTQIMHIVGKATAESARVEVPFEAVAPDDSQYWSGDSRSELTVPLGRTGATRLQSLRLGRGVAQHMLIAGKTGSGKSTLLHVMITNLALWYGPDEVELYLIDFKQGVEFKTYVTHHLPHARAVAIESDREFGLSILQRLAAEMAQRGDLFRQAGVQDIAAYRNATGQTMPRTVLIVDEFQIFFGEDDKIAQDASVLLEQLVRQGRAFGIHVVLGSQTLGGAFGLAHSTMGQMAVRIALQCSEADSQLILDDDNVAARLLSRPGEAIYNDVGGRVAGNSPFQTAWLPDSTRDTYLDRITRQAPRPVEVQQAMIVFEGNAPADIRENQLLASCAEQEMADVETSAPQIWLGAPVTIKEPTAVTLRRQSGASLLIVGQRDEVAMNLMSTGIVSLATQLRPSVVHFVVLDSTPPDSPLAGTFDRVAEALPHEIQMISWSDVSDTLGALAQEVDKRVESDHRNAPTVIFMVYGLQRYRMLRRSEDAFGLSFDEETAEKPDAQFARILREGPAVGVHVITWADTLGTLERTLDRQTLREFDHRVLFQMSATDSSNLIDSPTANQLGLHRALLYSEEQGGEEKFRPYDALDGAWLAKLGKRLGRRADASDPKT